MSKLFSALTIALFAFTFSHIAGVASAQGQPKQIKLNDKQVQGYIAAQKDVLPIAQKIQGDKPDPKILAQIEAAAKKHGFANLAEFEEVAANVSLIYGSIDPETKSFVQPAELIKREIADINADKSIPANEKKQALDELNQALKTVQPVQYPENIELVKKYYKQIEATIPQDDQKR